MITFPLTLDHIGYGHPGYYPHQVLGEYQYNGYSYVAVLENMVNGKVQVYKKDGTWSLQDSAGAPSNAYWSYDPILNGGHFGVVRVADVLWFLLGKRPAASPIGPSEMIFWGFDLTTDQWNTDPVQGGPTMAHPASYRPLAFPVARSTGEVVVLYNSTNYRCSIVRCNPGAGTWETPQALPVPDAGMTYHFATSAVVDPDDNVHCLYTEHDGAAWTVPPTPQTGHINHTTYLAANSFGPTEACCLNTAYSSQPVNDSRYVSNLVYFDESGDKLGFTHITWNYAEGVNVYDLYYCEGTLSGTWSWTEELVAGDCQYDSYTTNNPIIPTSFCFFGSVKYAFWIRLDPPSWDPAGSGETAESWIEYSYKAGPTWMAPAQATQKVSEEVNYIYPSFYVVQAYNLEGKFSLVAAYTHGVPDYHEEFYTISGDLEPPVPPPLMLSCPPNNTAEIEG